MTSFIYHRKRWLAIKWQLGILSRQWAHSVSKPASFFGDPIGKSVGEKARNLTSSPCLRFANKPSLPESDLTWPKAVRPRFISDLSAASATLGFPCHM